MTGKLLARTPTKLNISPELVGCAFSVRWINEPTSGHGYMDWSGTDYGGFLVLQWTNNQRQKASVEPQLDLILTSSNLSDTSGVAVWWESLITCCFPHAADIHSEVGPFFNPGITAVCVSTWLLSQRWCENRLTESACHMVKHEQQERQQTEGHVAHEHKSETDMCATYISY